MRRNRVHTHRRIANQRKARPHELAGKNRH